MLQALTVTHRLRDRTRVHASTVGQVAAQLRKQFPQNPWLEASHRADRAYVAGHIYHFRLWGRVAQALRSDGASALAAAC
jgi:hypothetical protein